MVRLTKKLLSLLLLLLFISCVGTVEETEEEITNSKNYRDYGISFNGIEEVSSIAHNKVDVSFAPASGGTGTYTYIVYRDGNFSIPVASIPSFGAVPDEEGKIHIQVGGLSIGTSYSFAVRVYDVVYNSEDTNTKLLVGSTLSYEVPLFDGVKNIEPVAGSSGETQLKLSWTEAQPSSASSDPFGSNPNAISGYNVYVGTSTDSLALASFVSGSSSLEYIATNLTPGTTYYARVRAVNTLNVEDKNIKTLARATKTSEPIQFSGIASVSVPQNINGYTQLNITWSAGTGSFDRYRIYSSPTSKTSFDPTTDDAYKVADITTLTTTSFTVTGLTPHTTNYISVVACKDNSCAEFAGNTIVKNAKTTPPVAPFNGISSLTLPSDVTGLDTAVATFTLPNTASGTYDEIRFFKITGPGNFFDVNQPLPEYNSSDPTRLSVERITDTQWRIKNLTTGSENCFVAKAYATTPVDPLDNPVDGSGRTHTNEVKRCITPQYTSPGFSGVSTSCTNVTSTSFTINWTVPSPVGFFDTYEIWYRPKLAGQSFDFNEVITKFNDGVTNNETPYKQLFATKGATSITISNLTPGTKYQVGMKTKFGAGSTIIVGSFSGSITGKTIYDGNFSVSTCSTAVATVENQGWNEVISLGRRMKYGNPSTALNEYLEDNDSVYRFPYPKVDESNAKTLGVEASNQGMIRIAWKDFIISGVNKGLREYPGSGNGYRVYRMEHRPEFDSTPLTLSSAGWTLVSGTTPITPMTYDNLKWEGMFTDYSVTKPANPFETRIYYYVVKAVLNETDLNFTTTQADAIIRVVLPPDNMALVHRWMANKDICSSMNRAVDRSNNYRCLYKGLGSVVDAGNFYYDFKGDYLVTRWHVGAKVSLTGCTNSNLTGQAGSNLSPGACVYWATPDTVDRSYGSRLTDTVGNPSVVGLTSSTDYAVALNANGGMAYYKNPGTSNWIRFSFVEEYGRTHSQTILPSNTAPYIGGQGVGSKLVTLDSMAPQAKFIQNQAFHACASFSVSHKGTSQTMRLPRRKEWWAMSHGHHRNVNYETIIRDAYQTSGNDKDCSSYQRNTTYFPGLTDQSSFDWNKQWYRGNVGHDEFFGLMKSGSYGDFSSEACVSRYGIQDIYFARNTRLSDIFRGRTEVGTGVYMGFYEGMTTANDPFSFSTALYSDPMYVLDPDAKENWKNYDNSYFFLMDSNWDGPVGHSKFVAHRTIGHSNLDNKKTWFNAALGIHLSCKDDLSNCRYDGTDDNTLLSTEPGEIYSTYQKNLGWFNQELVEFSTTALSLNVGKACDTWNFYCGRTSSQAFSLVRENGWTEFYSSATAVRCGIMLDN